MILGDNIDPFLQIHQLVKAGRFDSALKLIYSKSENRIKRDFRIDSNHAWYCVGDIFFKKKLYQQAKVAFKKALRSRPLDREAIMAVGNCYDQLARPKLAERYFRSALASPEAYSDKVNPDSIRFNLANSLLDQGRLSEAAELYRILSKSPTEIGALAKKNLKHTNMK